MTHLQDGAAAQANRTSSIWGNSANAASVRTQRPSMGEVKGAAPVGQSTGAEDLQ